MKCNYILTKSFLICITRKCILTDFDFSKNTYSEQVLFINETERNRLLQGWQ